MTEIVQWITVHPALVMMIEIGMLEGIVLLILLITARRVRLIRNEMDSMCIQVKNYLDVVLENEQENVQESQIETIQKVQREEEENRIISTVLQEIFP